MSERERLKPEEKVKIARKFLTGAVNICRAATEAGVDRETLQSWVMLMEISTPQSFLEEEVT